MTDVIINGKHSDPVFIFAHGAGAGMEHPFMSAVASGLEQKGIQVIRFEFPYMQKRREDGKKRPPDRAPKLLEHFQSVIEQHASSSVVIGGKSMGGRMASLLAEHHQVAAAACLGFPFHPPGKPENFKGAHLASIEKPCLILQGERDTFGKKEEVAEFSLSKSVKVHYIPDGDHSFKPSKSSGFTEEQNIAQAVEVLSQFIFEVANAS
ncbi:dienelactone hydrolase family protein [Vibrio sp. S4M6]|uniref:alpha/beta family hydrolase n=1 Tax=Vibrio sinus TaxID=2946865 RepID=UPI002029C016|nr:alpha/beta family hydrolase [Vibrio sinus]MCL9782783.1 dienelactone hydrolase family protein [Vibrio sinus]